MVRSDNRRVVGARVEARAMLITSAAECQRRYGTNKKTKKLVGTVVSVEIQHAATTTGRAKTLVTADWELGGGDIKRAPVNIRSVHECHVPHKNEQGGTLPVAPIPLAIPENENQREIEAMHMEERQQNQQSHTNADSYADLQEALPTNTYLKRWVKVCLACIHSLDQKEVDAVQGLWSLSPKQRVALLRSLKEKKRNLLREDLSKRRRGPRGINGTLINPSEEFEVLADYVALRDNRQRWTRPEDLQR